MLNGSLIEAGYSTCFWGFGLGSGTQNLEKPDYRTASSWSKEVCGILFLKREWSYENSTSSANATFAQW